MPMLPNRPCMKSNCPNLHRNKGSYCDVHKKEHDKLVDDTRLSSRERGYNYRWEQARLLFLKQNPLCAECLKENIVKQGDCVDHIIPHKGNYELFWDETNWQTLCNYHHGVKTMKEQAVHVS